MSESGITTCDTPSPAAGAVEQRRRPRKKQHLVGTCSIQGPFATDRLGIPLTCEVFDLSAEGVGLCVVDPAGSLDASDLVGLKARISIPSPGNDRPVDVRGTIRWCKPVRGSLGRVLRLGIQVIIDEGESVGELEQIAEQGKGDMQFLWNLWQAYQTRR